MAARKATCVTFTNDGTWQYQIHALSGSELDPFLPLTSHMIIHSNNDAAKIAIQLSSKLSMLALSMSP